MAVWVFCNYCFQQPKANSCRFVLTTCGHVVCESCLSKGNMDICCVCKARCHTLFLSDKMDPDLKALFTQPEKICERYLKEFVQIMDFQEKHRRHLCANEIEEHAKLKAYVQHMTQRKEQFQCEIMEMKNYIAKLESSLHQRQQTSRLPTPSSVRESVSTPLMKSGMYSSVPQSRPTTTEMSHKMEIDARPSPSAKIQSDASIGPARLSVISPPQDGRMGTVPYRGTNKVGTFRTSGLSTPVQQIGLSGSRSSAVLSQGEGRSRDTSSYRNVQSYPPTQSSSQSSISRPLHLIGKLGLLGLNISLCNWFLDFLTGRPQSVRIGNSISNTIRLSTGAPQGCVLSPLLFTLLCSNAQLESHHQVR
ncbi:probable E3 SUMO-protein ligase RNF212 [Chiloscyllium plagiosum]|uniref:probable E3 SUMO-protein ligase RNF212 n=1 Tax=Chiloscyllium plagiosum TaxID=36176 RepID=UPI001CB8578A|nr:probable E3 SUMO-protein ligase RNF212 [Chiloscyllium plagiosum]